MTTKTKKTRPSKSKKPSQSKKSDVDNSIAIAFLLDESGSMGVCRESAITGFNTFKREQAAVPGKAELALVTFNTNDTIRCQMQAIKDVPDLDYNSYIPGGSTALFDAIGRTVRLLEDKLSKMTEKPKQVLFAILTDGEENASQEYKTKVQIKTLIDLKTADGWTFIYLGANQDAYAEGSSIGVPVGNITNYVSTPIGTSQVYSSTSASARLFRSSGVRATASFFDDGSRPPVPTDYIARTPKTTAVSPRPAKPLSPVVPFARPQGPKKPTEL